MAWSEAAISYFTERAITPKIATVLGVGENGNGLEFPYRTEGEKFTRTRSLNGAGPKVRQAAGQPLAPWTPCGTDGVALICEGESDLLAVASVLYDVVDLAEDDPDEDEDLLLDRRGDLPPPLQNVVPIAIPGAGVAHEAVAKLLQDEANDASIVLDADDAGRRAAAKLKAAIDATDPVSPAAVVKLPEGSDLADCLAQLEPGERADWLATVLADAEAAAAQEEPRVQHEEATSTLLDFTEIVAKPIEWAWQDRIALSKITALAGRPKIGKGLLYSHLIAQVTRGELVGNLDGPRDAIIVTTEDDPGDTLKPRLMAAGADLAKVSIFTMGSKDEPVPFRVPQDAAELGRRVAQKRAAVVVVDPLIEFIDGKVDSHKSHPVRQAIAALNQIGREGRLRSAATAAGQHAHHGPTGRTSARPARSHSGGTRDRPAAHPVRAGAGQARQAQGRGRPSERTPEGRRSAACRTRQARPPSRRPQGGGDVGDRPKTARSRAEHGADE